MIHVLLVSPLSVIGVVADGAGWQYQVTDEPGWELTCQVITEADDDNKTDDDDGQNILSTCCSPGGKSVFNSTTGYLVQRYCPYFCFKSPGYKSFRFIDDIGCLPGFVSLSTGCLS